MRGPRLPRSTFVINRAGGIVGGIENQHARFWRDFCGDFAEVRLKFVFFFERERYGFGAEAAGERRIDGKARIGIEHFVTGLDQRHHGQRESHFASGSDQDLFRFQGKLASAREVMRDFFAQSGNAACGE